MTAFFKSAKNIQNNIENNKSTVTSRGELLSEQTNIQKYRQIAVHYRVGLYTQLYNAKGDHVVKLFPSLGSLS